MAVDISTLFFVLGVMASLATAFSWFLLANNRTMPGVRAIAVSNTLHAFGFICIVLRAVLPGFISFVVGNIAVCCGYFLFYHGLRQFTGRRSRFGLLAACVATYAVEFTWFYLVDNDFKVRLFFYLTTYGTLMACGLGIAVAEYRHKGTVSMLVAGLFMGFLSLAFLGTAAISLSSGPAADIFSLSLINASVVFEQIVFVVGWLMSFTLMVNQRLYDEKVQAERELSRHATSLEASNRELEEFSYVISHDLQEPLRNIASYAQLLRRRYASKLDAEADEFITFMVDGVHRMKVMINDILEYSRLERRDEVMGDVDLAEILRGVRLNLRTEITRTNATITADPLPAVRGIAGQLSSLMQNLIDNAIKYQPAGQSPEISITVLPDKDGWTIRVTDNGIGIDPTYFEQIFIAFRRLHTRTTYDGSGVGLAICRRIVERHQGRIWVESSPGRGTTFAFTLPGPNI